MPLGPYKNWDACIRAQMKKGKSKESAEKICGYLEKKSKGQSSLVSWFYNILWKNKGDSSSE